MGLFVVLGAHSGDVLQSVAPSDVHAGRIMVRGRQEAGAEHVVDTYVTAATAR